MSVFIIAEAGVNHNGCLETAKKMVDEAKKCGADCVKFQTYISENIVSNNAPKAEYQKACTNTEETQFEMLKKLELSFEEFEELDEYCKEKGIEFLSTAFDLDSIRFLSRLGMKRWKVPSGDITNLPYLITLAKLGEPIIISTGMSTMEEVREAISVLKDNGAGEITALHCTTAYPTDFREVNLRAMKHIQKEIGVAIGYSDHTKGIEIAVAAVAQGATVIEKHFTLSRTMEGPDHKASLEPDEFKTMVKYIRNVEVAIGDGVKKVTETEIENRVVARKSIVAKRSIVKGEVFSEESLAVKRPGNGISPMEWYEIVGGIAVKNYDKDEMIEK